MAPATPDLPPVRLLPRSRLGVPAWMTPGGDHGRISGRRRWPLHRLPWTWITLLFLGIGMAAPSTEAPEYAVKAAFLYNLAKFVRWPEATFSTPHQPLTIGVLGDDPFGTALEATLANPKSLGRPMQVWRGKNLDRAGSLHILYIADDQRANLSPIFKSLEGRPVLTVSSLAGFCSEGGMVEFFIQNNRVRLIINREAADQAQLTISSKLLQVAVLYPPAADREN